MKNHTTKNYLIGIYMAAVKTVLIHTKIHTYTDNKFNEIGSDSKRVEFIEIQKLKRLHFRFFQFREFNGGKLSSNYLNL